MSETLDKSEAALWQNYLDLEAQGLRRPALHKLDEFIAALLQAPAAHRDRFAQQLCLSVVEYDEKIPVRHPLFVKILWPFLVNAYKAGSAAAPIWLAHFVDLADFQQLREALNLAWPTRETLLREALARDPSNSKIRRQLISEMAQYFDHTIHELPAGVLYGMDGASVAECQELLTALHEFRELIHVEDMFEVYQDRIETWRFHYQSYADYLTHHQNYKSYAEYLQYN